MLIGLCGRPHSGKTLVANILKEEYGFEIINSKTILYEMSSMVTGLPCDAFIEQDQKNNSYKGVTHRQITGRLGTAIEDMFGDSFLVDRAVQNFRADRGVVDSLRKTQTIGFPGIVVEILSDRGIVTGNPFDEFSREEIGYFLMNNGNLVELERNIEEMVRRLHG